MSELAEGARLEIVCAAKSGTEGSNPSLSAIIKGVKVFRFSVQRLDDGRKRRISDASSQLQAAGSFSIKPSNIKP